MENKYSQVSSTEQKRMRDGELGLFLRYTFAKQAPWCDGPRLILQVWWEILIMVASREAAKEIRDTMVNILDSIA